MKELNMYESYKPKHHFTCEVDDCGRDATTEWNKVDDGVYYTMRCEIHPELDEGYEPTYLEAHEHDFSEGKYSNECLCKFKLEKEPIDV